LRSFLREDFRNARPQVDCDQGVIALIAEFIRLSLIRLSAISRDY